MSFWNKTWVVTGISTIVICLICGVLLELNILYAAASILAGLFLLSSPLLYMREMYKLKKREKYYRSEGHFAIPALCCFGLGIILVAFALSIVFQFPGTVQ